MNENRFFYILHQGDQFLCALGCELLAGRHFEIDMLDSQRSRRVDFLVIPIRTRFRAAQIDDGLDTVGLLQFCDPRRIGLIRAIGFSRHDLVNIAVILDRIEISAQHAGADQSSECAKLDAIERPSGVCSEKTHVNALKEFCEINSIASFFLALSEHGVRMRLILVRPRYILAVFWIACVSKFILGDGEKSSGVNIRVSCVVSVKVA
jgi:hypothetical protein